MLLVSAEKGGCVSHTVGGGPAAEASPQHAPFELPPGEAITNNIKLTAGSKTTQQFLLHASDYVSWICTEDFGYTIDFSVKLWARHPHSQVQCVNKPLKLVGVDRSRLVTEKARGTAFQGYLDLSGEHAECLSACNSATEEPVAILVLEMDNVFSFFMEKAVTVQVSKRAKAQATQSSHRSLSMGRLTDASGRLADVEASPSARSDATSGLAGSRGSRGSGSNLERRAISQSFRVEDHRVARLRGLLREALRLCPDDGAREHLLAAQAQIEEYAQQEVEEDSGPLS